MNDFLFFFIKNKLIKKIFLRFYLEELLIREFCCHFKESFIERADSVAGSI
jgi:hypothetical protein